MIVSITRWMTKIGFLNAYKKNPKLNDVPFLKHHGNNNDDFVPTLSRPFHQGLVDKARQMNYDDESRSKTQSIST